MEVNTAIALVDGWVSSLAELPPPSPQHPDDMGFSASTDGPLRSYLALIRAAGEGDIDPPTIDQHFAAVSYLREHSRTQIPRAIWEQAFEAIRKAWRDRIMENEAVRASTRAAVEKQREGKTSKGEQVTREEMLVRNTLKAGAAKAGNSALKGELPKVGSWEYLPGRKAVKVRTNLRKDESVRVKAVHFKERGVEVSFPPRDEPFGWIIPVRGMAVAADLFEAGWPTLSQAIRTYIPEWLQLSGESLMTAAQTAPGAAPGAAPGGKPDSRMATVQAGFEGTAEKGKSFGGAVWHWEWKPENPESILLLIPGKDVSMNIPVKGVNAFRGYEYWKAYPLDRLDEITEYAARYSTGFPAAVAAFRDTWLHRPEAAPEDVRRAKQLVRRFKYMMHPDVRKDEARLEETLGNMATLLSRVKPGDTKVDLGAYGAFEVEWNEKDPQSSKLLVYMPYHWKDWSMGLRGARKSKGFDGRWRDEIDIKHVPSAARRLDLVSPPLAIALRVAVLTETIRECYELEEIAGATSLDEVADPVVRNKIERIIARVTPFAKLPLLPYQEIGVAFAELTGWKCMIGDSMGLGKTPQGLLCLASNVDELTPALVVAPLSVTRNWVTEAEKFTDNIRGSIIDAKTDLRKIGRGQFGVVTWSSLDRFLDRLSQKQFKCIIFDESHLGKNAKAARTKAAIQLSSEVPHRILLTGTAMENNPEELWSQFHMIDPAAFPEFKEFKAKYGSTTHRVVGNVKFVDDRGMGFDDDEAPDDGSPASGKLPPQMQLVLAELREALRCFMIRRMNHEVNAQIPELRRQTIWIDLPPDLRKAYDRVDELMEQWIVSSKQRTLLREALAWLKHEENMPEGSVKLPRNVDQWASWLKAPGASAAIDAAVEAINATTEDYNPSAGAALVALGHLRRIVGLAKARLGVEWVLEFLETTQHRSPLIVVVEHQKPLQLLREALDENKIRWTYIDGSVTGDKRHERVQAFQAGEYDVIVVTRAAAEGVNLYRSSDVVFLERMWVPAKEEQLEARAHRTGQKNAVLARYFMARDTVDDRIAEIIDRKRELMEAVLRGKEAQAAELRGGSGGLGTKATLADILDLRMEAKDFHIDAEMVRKAIRAGGVSDAPEPDFSKIVDEDGALEAEEAAQLPVPTRRQSERIPPAVISRAEFEAWLLEHDAWVSEHYGVSAAVLVGQLDDATWRKITHG